MRGAFDIFLAVALVVVLLGVPASGDENYERRLEDLSVRFAERYLLIATRAKRRRLAELTQRAYDRAETIAPGHEPVIEFDPGVRRPLPASRVRSAAKLGDELEDAFRDEAAARRELAIWCNGEAMLPESVEQAVEALALLPGKVTFDAEGTLAAPPLAPLPLSLSLSVLDAHEVFRGSIVRREDVPETVPWEDAWRLTTKHFTLVTSVSGDLCRTLGRALEAAREIYREETGYEVADRITVHVPATRKEYIGLWLARNRPKPKATNLGRCRRDYCAVDGSRPAREVISVAIHEVAHGYLNLGLEAATGKRGVTMPAWYHEGLATYCAGYGKGSHSYSDGVVLPEAAREAPLRRFREILEDGRAPKLPEFLSCDAEGEEYYLEAYAFYWFLKETKDKAVRKGLPAALAALRKARLTADDRGPRGREIFLKEIGVPVEKLGALLSVWVKSLPATEPAMRRGV